MKNDKEADLDFKYKINTDKLLTQLKLSVINKGKIRAENVKIAIFDSNDSLLNSKKINLLKSDKNEAVTFCFGKRFLEKDFSIGYVYIDSSGKWVGRKFKEGNNNKKKIRDISELSYLDKEKNKALDWDKIENPYRDRRAITEDSMFFGRKSEVTLIHDHLAGENIIILTGLRKAGKTSLAYHLDRKGFKKKYLPIILDIESCASKIEEDSQFYYVLSKKIKENFQNKSRKYYEITKDIPIRLDEKEYAKEGFDAFKGDLKEILTVLKKEDKTLVLILDEFVLLKELLKGRSFIVHNLRSLSQERDIDNLKIILISPPSILEWQTEEQPLYGVTRVSVANLFGDSDATRALIAEPIKEYQISFDQEALDYIEKMTAGYPTLIQAICFEVLFRIRLKRDKSLIPIKKGYVEEIVRYMLSDNKQKFQIFSDFWDHEVCEKNQKLILSCLAHLSEKNELGSISLKKLRSELIKRSINLSPDKFSNILNKFCEPERGRFLKKGRTESEEAIEYNFFVPLLKFWINEWGNIIELTNGVKQNA